MTKEELIQFLKKNLTIEVSHPEHDVGYYDEWMESDEHTLQAVIEQLKEKRDNSLGKDYNKYTKEITILNGCLKECKIKNSIRYLKESNKNY